MASPLETQEEEEEEEENVAFHPPAPSSQLFDTTTTVDPSYIISLIRKLIPHGGSIRHDSQGKGTPQASVIGSRSSPGDGEQIQEFLSHFEIINGRDSESGAAEIAADHDRLPYRRLTNEKEETINHQVLDEKNSPYFHAVDDEMNPESQRKKIDEAICNAAEHHGVSILSEDPWEECGCILWDLAANRTHAEFMVENLLPEVLLASLIVSNSMRVTEICLGILGNLACHEVPRNAITSTTGLIETIVNQLFLDDSICLCETFRLLTLGLQGGGSVKWGEVLRPENVLCRILWITENTLNSQLLQKCLELLLTIGECQQVVPILLPPLLKLGLLSLLLSLLSCEMTNMTDGRGLDRSSVLDSILCVIESLSTINDYSRVLSSNKELFQLVCGVIKLPDKVEVAGSCVTTVVLIANILTDEPNLASEISQDLPFLQGLLDILPFTSDDSQARAALWNVLLRVLIWVEEYAMRQSNLHKYASILMEKSETIEEDLDDHREDSVDNSPGMITNAITASLKRIANILDLWISTRHGALEKDTIGEEDASVGKRVQRLLYYCHKYSM